AATLISQHHPLSLHYALPISLASSIATETILSELHRWWHKVPKRTPESIEAAMKRGIDIANKAIYQKANTSPEHHGMGTTTTLRSEEHTSELQSRVDLVCRLL